VLFYHYDCDRCLQAIPLYRSAASSMRAAGSNVRFAFVAMPPTAPAGRDPVSSTSNDSRMSLRPTHDWFASTPLAVAIDEGTVVWAQDSDEAVHPPVVPKWNN